MACTASKTPLLRAISKRGYAVCPRLVGDTSAINVNVLENKLVVATAEASVPVSRVSLVLRAGSRNESYDTLGASHLLRLAGSMSTQRSTAFAIARHIQQVGGTLTAWGDREFVGYTVETTADNVETGLNYLQDLLLPTFKPWEIKDNTKTLINQLNAVSTEDRAIELVHKAAFRRGLGNSIYIPRFRLGNISSESLLHFAASNFNAGSAAVVGVGIDNNTLSGFAQNLAFPSGGSGAKSASANYYGGDARKDTAGHRAVVAVAGEGAAASNQKEALAFAILKQAVAGVSTKRGNPSGLFGEAANCAGDSPITVKGLNASYSDGGLFGFVASGDSKDIGKAVDFLVRALKSGSISDKDVSRGKAALKARVVNNYSSDSGLIKEIGRQAALNRTVLEADALVAAIDGVSVQQVQAAAKKVAGSKLSVGAIGNLANVPYASDLA